MPPSSSSPSPPPPLCEIQNEIVSYQRFGRLSKIPLTNPKFRCHLCGFSCLYKDTLLTHFREKHPN